MQAPMLRAAVDRGCTTWGGLAQHRFGFGNMNAALGARQHGMGALGVVFERRVGATALLSNPPQPEQDDQQQHQILQGIRSKITSSTKREPT